MLKKKIAMGLTVLTLAVTQTGCIVGFCLGPFGAPFWAAGLGTAGVGAVVGIIGLATGNLPTADVGGSLMLVGSILDKDNPGSVELYNPLSQDSEIVGDLGLTPAEVKHYNSQLNYAIPKAAGKIIAEVKTPIEEIGKKIKANPTYDIYSDAALIKIAKDFGFKDVHDLVTIFKGDRLPTDHQKKIAQHIGLDAQSTRILLARSGIQVE